MTIPAWTLAALLTGHAEHDASLQSVGASRSPVSVRRGRIHSDHYQKATVMDPVDRALILVSLVALGLVLLGVI